MAANFRIKANFSLIYACHRAVSTLSGILISQHRRRSLPVANSGRLPPKPMMVSLFRRHYKHSPGYFSSPKFPFGGPSTPIYVYSTANQNPTGRQTHCYFSSTTTNARSKSDSGIHICRPDSNLKATRHSIKACPSTWKADSRTGASTFYVRCCTMHSIMTTSLRTMLTRQAQCILPHLRKTSHRPR